MVRYINEKGEIIEVDGRLSSRINDKHGNELFEGDKVQVYHMGTTTTCIVVFHNGMFSLKWPDGYINGAALTPNKYTKILE